MAKKRAKKAKSKPTKAKREQPQFEIGNPVKTAGLRFVTGGPRSTMYEPIITKMRGLKEGESIPVGVPDDTHPRVIHNRVQAVINRMLKRKDLEPPKGCVFEKKTGSHPQTGKPCVIINCRKDDGRKKPGPKSKK